MLPRLYLLRRHAAAPSPTHNHPHSLCDDLIRRGSARKATMATRATSAVGRSSPFPAVSRQPSAVSRQPSAVSRLRLQPPASPLTRATRSHRQALRTVQPTSHPSGARQAPTDPAALRPMRWPDPAPSSAPKYPPAATLKVINTYVNNLLITC